MKACLNAFKSIANVEKSVEKCRLVIDPEEDRLVVNLTCKHGIHKVYNLSFIECETMQAIFDKSSCRYCITSQSRVLSDAFINFQSNQEEVTLAASPQKAIIRNYVDDDPDPAKCIHTELTIEADEFDNYSIAENSEVTFCLKEVRSLLSFSEPANLPICISYSIPGSPIIFSVDNPQMFEANFVLATLTPNQRGSQCSLKSQQTGKSKTVTNTKEHKKSLKRSEVKNDQSIHRNHVSRVSSEYIAECSFREDPKHDDIEQQSNENTGKSLKVLPPLSIDRNGEEINRCSSSEARREAERPEENEDEIPGTPPAKRRRFYFKRCFEPTFNQNDISNFNKILAEDSDPEENVVSSKTGGRK